MSSPSFVRHGPAEPLSPVVLSVPHAGRDYPLALRAALGVPLERLRPLEDRHADSLAHAARAMETMFVAGRARAWIDLNRGEHERDPRIDDGASLATLPFQSAKLRCGLGLIPRRVGHSGDIWKRRLSGDEVLARIHADHRPYHAALAATLARAHARFGVAVLLDLHSMPSLDGKAPPRLVFGDRFGRSAASRFLGRLEGVARAHKVPYGTNTPYPGGHILDRHGAPRQGVHAIQIEFDRQLYLDSRLDAPGEGLEATARILRDMIDAIADEAVPTALAAE